MKYSFTIFDPAYWLANPKQGSPRWVFDTVVKTTSLDWPHIIDLLVGAHVAEDTKQHVAMFNACAWKMLSGADTDVVVRSGTSYVRKCEANVTSISMLVLDYDDGTPIDVVVPKLRRYQHIGYTSHSHTDAHHKFRIVIPLTEPLPASLMTVRGEKSILPALADAFQRIDETTFDRARAFFLPAAPHATFDQALSWHNKGEPFDWTTLPVTIRMQRQRSVFAPSNTVNLLELFHANGLYIDKGTGKKHNVLCPWRDRHTHDIDGGAVVFEGEGFNCKHSHCKQVTHKQLLEFFNVSTTTKGYNDAHQPVRLRSDAIDLSENNYKTGSRHAQF